LDNHEIAKPFAKYLDKVVTEGICAKTWFAQKIIEAPRSYDVLAKLANMIENCITETAAITAGMKQRGIKKCLMPLKPVPVEEDEESSVEIDLEKLVMSKNPKSRGVEEVPRNVIRGRYTGDGDEIERTKKASKGRSKGDLDEEPTADEEKEKANGLERYQKGKGTAKSKERKQ
jgi:hypothetical protein